MDKLEYIPGDLVMTNGVPLGTSKNVVYRVTSSDPSKTLMLDDGTVMKGVVRLENLEGVEFGDKGYLFGDCCAWVKDIVPIPVTSEILKKNDIMNDFLSLLPFQKGDKVKDKDGNIFIIERLKDAISLDKNEIKVHFLIRKIKKNGEPYQYANQAWGIDYFSLEKVVE